MNKKNKELWLPVGKVINESGEVFDFTENVLASNKGRIFVLPAVRGNNNRFMSGYIANGRQAGGLHIQVKLYDNNGKSAFFYVHRLVAFAWLKRKIHQNVVMHIDDNPTNNCVDNLMWGTQQQNMKMRYVNNTSRGPKKKYTDSLIWEVFGRRENGETLDSIRKAYPNITPSSIAHMTSGKLLKDRKLL